MHKIILTTGGTGGHIFPAIAVAEQLRISWPNVEILFIGSNYGPEKDLAEKAGIEFAGLNVRGVLGRGFRAPIALLKLAMAIPIACKLIKKFKPDCIAGFGGYASFAPVIAGFWVHVPILLHEQNAIPGSSNLFLSKFARTICASLPNTEGIDKKKIIFTGNPVRKAIGVARTGKRGESNSRRLLVLGGSQGAHALNVYLPKILDELKKNNVEIIHQTGNKDWKVTAKEYEKHGYNASCARPFIEDIATAYAWADIVLCRSGASTVAELCMAGLPAIFVPFPAAIHDHQTKNARALEMAGAACLVPEDKIGEAGNILLDLMNKPEKLEKMSENALKLATPDAAAGVVKAIQSLIAHKKTNWENN